MPEEGEDKPESYTRVPLISSQSIDQPESVLCLAAWGKCFLFFFYHRLLINLNFFTLGSSIYLGTSNGEICHYFKATPDVPYIIASKQKSHPKKTRPVGKILLFPIVSRAVVLANSSTSIFSLPEFAPCTGMGSLRDVNDLSYDIDDRSFTKEDPGSNNEDVNGEAEITVFSKTVIRIVKVQSEALRLKRNIDYPGVLVGVRRSSYALVANSESYDLIDLQNIRKIPLFPISPSAGDKHDGSAEGEDKEENKVNVDAGEEQEEVQEEEESRDIEQQNDSINAGKFTPMIAPVATDEFLVTSGTKPGEPAMGIVVNVDGDISRGTIAWPEYPTSIAVDFPNVAAVIGNSVMIYSLQDQALVQEIKYANTNSVPPIVTNVLGPYNTPYQPLADRIRLEPLMTQLPDEELQKKREVESSSASKLSVITSSLFVYSVDAGVECLLSSPRLIQMEKLIWKGRLDDVILEIETLDISTELAVLEMEYFQLFVALGHLLHGDFGSAADAWLEGAGATLDPRLVIYIFSGKTDLKGDVWLFNGAFTLVETIIEKLEKSKKNIFGRRKSETGDSNSHKFYQYFLQEWLKKRDLESVVFDKKNVFESLELAYLRLSINFSEKKEDIYHIIDNEIIESYEGAVEMLVNNNRYFLLSRLYQKRGCIKDVLESWKKMLTGEWPDKEFTHGEDKMAAYLIQCHDKELVWEYGMWLVNHAPQAGIRVFTNENAICKFDDNEVLTEFKNVRNNHGEVWRQYLKYLVYEKKSNLFTSDLIAFLADDMIQKLNNSTLLQQYVEKTGSDYQKLRLPKTKFVEYLNGLKMRQQQGGEDDETKMKFLQLRLELIELLETNVNYDASKLVELISPTYSNLLLMELAIAYGRLGVHETVLEILCHSLGDYNTALEYCQAGSTVGLVFGDEKPESPDTEIQRDLFKALFLEFLKIKDEDTKVKITRRLLDQWGTKLDVQLVLTMTPDKWPVEVLEDYLSNIFRGILNDKNQSILNRSLNRSQHLFLTQNIQDLQNDDI